MNGASMAFIVLIVFPMPLSKLPGFPLLYLAVGCFIDPVVNTFESYMYFIYWFLLIVNEIHVWLKCVHYNTYRASNDILRGGVLWETIGVMRWAEFISEEIKCYSQYHPITTECGQCASQRASKPCEADVRGMNKTCEACEAWTTPT